MSEKVRLKRVNYRHFIAIGITLTFVLLSVLVFPTAYIRLFESLRDLIKSIGYYFGELFGLENLTSPTVNDVSSIKWTPVFNLPATWEEFVLGWKVFWQNFISSDNITAYLDYLAKLVFNFSQIILLVIVPLFLIIYLIFQRYLSKHNNDYAKDSKSLKFFKRFADKTYIPIKNWLVSFYNFCKQKKYFKIWLWIWLFNFNAIAIIIEFFAFYFYFVMSFNFNSIYIQLYKLMCDLSVAFAFIPLFVWLLLVYMYICHLRKKIGYARLNHFENKNCGFINERPIVSMICASMGKKKTTMLTDMVLSQEKMFRDKAFELIGKNDLKFPYFPWVNLENAIKRAFKYHLIYNLATCRKFINHLEFCFQYQNTDLERDINRHLRRRFKIKHKNLIFDYDFERYGLEYNDNLSINDIWSVIRIYSQLYFIYIIQSSLIISNYSVRTDNIMSDLGNFPMWDNDFFERDCELQDITSRHSHIIDFDALRLGQKVLKDNYKANSFDFGVLDITEIGKERKNNLELKEVKGKEDIANQKNDGFNNMLKMIRHSATVDNFPFVKFFSDEQRPESWGADARDLVDIIHIKETSEKKLAMPFFNLFELLYNFVFSKFTNLYYKYRYMRSDNTLPMYLLKKFTAIVNTRYIRVYNTFGYCTLDVQIENGTQDGILTDKTYYLMNKKIYSKRFSTDCFSDYFSVKNLKSPIGINDLEEYETEKATFEELQQQNSYFVNDLINRQNND